MKIVDLTMTLKHGQPGVEFETKYTVAENGWNAKTLHLYSHTGTHMDSPFHFGVNDQTLDQIPLERCFVSGHIADISHLEPKSKINVADISFDGTIQPGDALLLRSGWSRHFNDPKHYRDNFQRISEELAIWIVEKKIGLIGVEPPSVADVNNLEEVTNIHHILLGGDVIIVEGLTNLDQIQSDQKFVFGAMPLKIRDGDGAPCRAFAILGINDSFGAVGDVSGE